MWTNVDGSGGHTGIALLMELSDSGAGLQKLGLHPVVGVGLNQMIIPFGFLNGGVWNHRRYLTGLIL